MLLTGCAMKYDLYALEAPADWQAQPDAAPRTATEDVALPSPADGDIARDLDWAVELIAQLEYAQAADILERWAPYLQADTTPPRVAEVGFWLGYCSEKQDLLDEARDYYSLVLARFPREPAAAQAYRRLNALGPKAEP